MEQSAATDEKAGKNTSGVTGASAGASRWRSAFQGLAVLCLSLGIAVVAIEFALRFVHIKPNEIEYGDRVLGFVPKPNTVQTFEFPEYGPSLVMRINNLGFHNDADTQLLKAPGYTRVAFVGDSQTAGLCPNRENFPNVFGQLLNARGKQQYEVINAGTGKYSPYQYYLRAKHSVVPLHPDRLIVGFYLGNDLVDMARRDDRPYLTMNWSGSIEVHPPSFIIYEDPSEPLGWWQSTGLYALSKSVLGGNILYQMSRGRMLLENTAGTPHGPVDLARYVLEVKRLTDIGVGLMTQSLYQQIWFRHFPETLETSFALNEAVMRMFQDLCSAHGIRLTYILIPTKVRIEPERLGGLPSQLARYRKDLTIEGMQQFEDRLAGRVAESAQRLGIEVIDLTKPLLERKGSAELYYPSDMHLNVAGNRAVAGILADVLSGGEVKSPAPHR